MTRSAKAVLIWSGNLGFRGLLVFGALLTFMASCLSMAVIYNNPFAHLAVCLGGELPAPGDGTLVLYGHCAWCYLTVGLGLAALIVPPKQG